MKLLALADIHGAYDKVLDALRKEHADVVLICGDLTTVGSVKEAETALLSFQSVNRNILAVAGNMDLPAHDDLLVRLGVSINGRGRKIGDVGFFGVSAGPISPLRTPYEISEEEILRRARAGYEEVADCMVKAFVPHAPPYGTRVDIAHSGIHVGSTAVREFIEECKPDIVLCGHIHEARGQDKIENTIIVNCGSAGRDHYALCTLDEKIGVALK
jgi:hypothetical protein